MTEQMILMIVIAVSGWFLFCAYNDPNLFAKMLIPLAWALIALQSSFGLWFAATELMSGRIYTALTDVGKSHIRAVYPEIKGAIDPLLFENPLLGFSPLIAIAFLVFLAWIAQHRDEIKNEKQKTAEPESREETEE